MVAVLILLTLPSPAIFAPEFFLFDPAESFYLGHC